MIAQNDTANHHATVGPLVHRFVCGLYCSAARPIDTSEVLPLDEFKLFNASAVKKFEYPHSYVFIVVSLTILTFRSVTVGLQHAKSHKKNSAYIVFILRYSSLSRIFGGDGGWPNFDNSVITQFCGEFSTADLDNRLRLGSLCHMHQCQVGTEAFLTPKFLGIKADGNNVIICKF